MKVSPDLGHPFFQLIKLWEFRNFNLDYSFASRNLGGDFAPYLRQRCNRTSIRSSLLLVDAMKVLVLVVGNPSVTSRCSLRVSGPRRCFCLI